MGIILIIFVSPNYFSPLWLLSRTPKRTHKKKFWGLIFYIYYVVKNMNIMQTIQQIQMLLLNIRQICNHILCFSPVATN
jgi:hypothetical protein